MTKNTTPNAENILSTLSSDTAAVLESHFRQKLANELTHTAPTKPARRTAGRGRASQQLTNDGTNRSASQWIRDYDAENPGGKVKDVCEAATALGLTIDAGLVYNVRNIAKKNASLTDEERAAKAEARKAVLQANAAKARSARAAKKPPVTAVVPVEEKPAEVAEKPAKKAPKKKAPKK